MMIIEIIIITVVKVIMTRIMIIITIMIITIIISRRHKHEQNFRVWNCDNMKTAGIFKIPSCSEILP